MSVLEPAAGAARTAIIEGGEEGVKPDRRGLDTRPARRLRSAPMNAAVLSRKRMTAKKTTPPAGGRWSVL